MTHLAINQHNTELARVNITREGRGALGDCLEDAETRVMAKLADALHVEGMMETGYYSVELVNGKVVLDAEVLIL